MIIEIDDLNIYYEIHGSGNNLILLHGWGANVDSFKSVIEYFSKYFSVICLDLPGFGKSTPPNIVWGISEYAKFVEEFLQKLSIVDPILLGHSFGGRIIIYLLGNKKIKSKKAILIDSAGIKPKRKFSYYIKVYSFKSIKNLLQFPLWRKKTGALIEKARKVYGSSDYKNSSGILRNIMTKIVNEDLTKFLPYIDVPTLLIWGENDTVTPVSDGKLMEKLIPNAGLVILKEAGHFSYLEKSREFNIIVENFLGEDKT